MRTLSWYAAGGLVVATAFFAVYGNPLVSLAFGTVWMIVAFVLRR
jgi:hypothetical protein